MSRKRLSREDSRELTTRRLLDAARKLFAKKGFEAVSVETISQAAGYSRGAFYSNFDSKEVLFFELLRRDHQRKTDELNALVDDDVPIGQVRERANAIYSQMYRDNESCMNWTEARMLATRDARFRVRLNGLIADKQQSGAAFVEYFYRRVGVAPPIPPADLAMGFMSLAEGIKLYLLSSPTDLSPDAVESVLKVFTDSIMELALIKAAGNSERRSPARRSRAR